MALMLLGLVLAEPAHAAGWHHPSQAGYVFTDGDRLAAWMASPDTVHVRDDGQAREFGVPPTCPGPQLVAAGGERLLLECSGEESYRVMDAVTGAVAHAPPMPFAGDVQPFDVGLEWLAVSVTDEDTGTDYTGYVRLDGSEARREPGAPREVPDLDLPWLLRPMCGLLRRRRDDGAYKPYAYAPPLGLTQRGAGPELLLERCGRRPVELAVCRGLFACANPALTARYAAWSANRGTYLYDVRTGVTRRWRSPYGKRNVAVALTRRRLYVSYRRTLGGPSASYRPLSPP